MLKSDEALRAPPETAGEKRYRAEEPVTDEFAWLTEVARLMQPVHAR